MIVRASKTIKHHPRQAIVDTAVWVQSIDAKMLKNEQSLRMGEKVMPLEEDVNGKYMESPFGCFLELAANTIQGY